MNPYSYSISLRVRHPTADLEDFGSDLALKPKFSWRAGEPRLTPKGVALTGVRSESYWSAPLIRDGKLRSGDQPLEDELATVIAQLSPARETFVRIRAEGGDVELFIGIFCDGNCGFTLGPHLLSRIGALDVTLALDVYP